MEIHSLKLVSKVVGSGGSEEWAAAQPNHRQRSGTFQKCMSAPRAQILVLVIWTRNLRTFKHTYWPTLHCPARGFYTVCLQFLACFSPTKIPSSGLAQTTQYEQTRNSELAMFSDLLMSIVTTSKHPTNENNAYSSQQQLKQEQPAVSETSGVCFNLKHPNLICCTCVNIPIFFATFVQDSVAYGHSHTCSIVHTSKHMCIRTTGSRSNNGCFSCGCLSQLVSALRWAQIYTYPVYDITTMNAMWHGLDTVHGHWIGRKLLHHSTARKINILVGGKKKRKNNLWPLISQRDARRKARITVPKPGKEDWPQETPRR